MMRSSSSSSSPEDQMETMMMTMAMMHMDQCNNKPPHEYFTAYPGNPCQDMDMAAAVADHGPTLTPAAFHALPTPPVISFPGAPPPMLEDHTASPSSSPLPSSASVAAMREMIFRMAAMQPVHVDAEAVKPPRRKNVRISKDPQSVAARHRRERISERIRILQRMVPGGTKMDTASMLDEAIHYVKFLKRQVQSLEQQTAAPLPQKPMFPGFATAEAATPTEMLDWLQRRAQPASCADMHP